MKRLEGQVAIVTGGARGIGEGICEVFCREGAIVALWDVLDGSKTAERISKLGGKIFYQKVDVTSKESVDVAISEIINNYGKIEILINNAGIGFVMKHSREVTPAEWGLVIDVTLSGVFYCTQEAAKHMEAGGRGGRIINIASQAAKSGFPHMAPYCAAKHGVIGLTRTAAIDYGAASITVNAVCPNHVTTGLGGAQNAYFSAFKGMTEEAYLEEMAARIPMQRIGLAGDTAAMCAFLASDDASFITGEAINVSGGEEMH